MRGADARRGRVRSCDACRYFDAEARGCIEVDGARPDIDSVTDQTVKLAQSASLLSPRHVFVIRNADRYPPAAFDKLLKPMEDIGTVSFVLLARERTSVRLAGQSRCFDYRVRALSRPESEAFLREVLAVRGLVWDEARIGLLAEAGGGLPGRLIDASETVAGMGAASLEAIGRSSAWVGRGISLSAGRRSSRGDPRRSPTRGRRPAPTAPNGCGGSGRVAADCPARGATGSGRLGSGTAAPRPPVARGVRGGRCPACHPGRYDRRGRLGENGRDVAVGPGGERLTRSSADGGPRRLTGGSVARGDRVCPGRRRSRAGIARGTRGRRRGCARPLRSAR